MQINNNNFQNFKIEYPRLFGILDSYYGIENKAKFNLEKIILERIAQSKNYQEFWKMGILQRISDRINLPISGITIGFIPNYGGQVHFEEKQDNGIKKITQIQFYVSLLDHVYYIQILEIEESIQFHQLLGEKIAHQQLNELWVRPENHRLEGLYNEVEEILKSFFETSFYLPYSVQKIELQNTQFPSCLSHFDNTLGSAFFRMILPMNAENVAIKGNQYHGIELLK